MVLTYLKAVSLSFICHFDVAEGGIGGTAQPCVDNIKVANVTWHEVIHMDHYHTLRSTYVRGVKGQQLTL